MNIKKISKRSAIAVIFSLATSLTLSSGLVLAAGPVPTTIGTDITTNNLTLAGTITGITVLNAGDIFATGNVYSTNGFIGDIFGLTTLGIDAGDNLSPINIGGTNANAVNIGRAGVTTTIGDHIASAGTLPTLGVGSSCGGAAITAGSNDARGNVTSFFCNPGQKIVVHFATAFASAPYCLVMPINQDSAQVFGSIAVYASATITDLTITVSTFPAPDLSWNYICLQ